MCLLTNDQRDGFDDPKSLRSKLVEEGMQSTWKTLKRLVLMGGRWGDQRSTPEDIADEVRSTVEFLVDPQMRGEQGQNKNEKKEQPEPEAGTLCLLLQLVIGGSFGGVVPDLEEDADRKSCVRRSRTVSSSFQCLLTMRKTTRCGSRASSALDSLLQPKRRFDQEMKAHLATEYDVPIELNHLLERNRALWSAALNQRALQRQCRHDGNDP